LVVHFTNRKNAPFLFSTRTGTRPLGLPRASLFDDLSELAQEWATMTIPL